MTLTELLNTLRKELPIGQSPALDSVVSALESLQAVRVASPDVQVRILAAGLTKACPGINGRPHAPGAVCYLIPALGCTVHHARSSIVSATLWTPGSEDNGR